MAKSTGMVSVFGLTYRIVENESTYRIVRLLDDRLVGEFRCQPALELTRSVADPEILVAVVKTAQRSGMLRWSPAMPAERPSLARFARVLSRLRAQWSQAAA